MEEREIAGITNILKNLMKTAGNNFEKNQQIIAARNFFKRMNSLNRQDRNINYIVMITDIDISEFGYRKEQDNYYYSVKFPGVDVCMNAIRLNAGCDEVCFTRIRKLAAMKDIKEKDQIRKRLIYLLMLVIYGGSVAFVKTITGNYKENLSKKRAGRVYFPSAVSPDPECLNISVFRNLLISPVIEFGMPDISAC